VSTPEQVRRGIPWVLCAVSLAMLTLSSVLLWRFPDPAGGVTWLDGTVEALGFVGIPVVGALIASRLPGIVYGWLWCALGLAAGLSEIGDPLVRAVQGPRWAGWLLGSYGFVGLLGLIFFILLLFPAGRLPSPRWRWVARVAVLVELLLVLVVPFVHDTGAPDTANPWAAQGAVARFLLTAVQVTVYGMFGLVLAAIVSVVLRFRRAGPVERRQLTWFVYAAVLNGVVLVVGVALSVLPELLNTVLNAAGSLLLAGAVGIAVLKYRLYEIDRIVSRTVTYGLLTGCLVALYLLLVALLRALLEPLTGSSTLAVAASTLAVAAAFNPALRRLRAAVDRRFDRAHYDAGRAVEAFAARLRDQVDLEEISTGLRDTVTATVAPDRVAVWLRPADRP